MSMITEPMRAGGDLAAAASQALAAGITVVIPVYNSAGTLPELVARLRSILPGLAANHEIILVNDASPDQSWATIRELAAQYPEVRGIGLMRNAGQQGALLCGVRAAQYDITVTLDDDLQHPPEEIAKLLTGLAQGRDVVYGLPQQRRHNPARNLTSELTKLILKHLVGIPNATIGGPFRAFRTQLRDAFARFQGPYVSLDVLLSWGTTRFGAVMVAHQPRQSGRSGYSLGKLILNTFNIITGFSTMPLRMVSWIGFFMTLFGIGVLVYVVGRYLILGYSFPGFPFLASTIAIFSGAQLFALGIFGEYLARMHFRIMDRPPYVVRHTTDMHSATDDHDGRRHAGSEADTHGI